MRTRGTDRDRRVPVETGNEAREGRGMGGKRSSAARAEAGDRRGRRWAAEVMQGMEGEWGRAYLGGARYVAAMVEPHPTRQWRSATNYLRQGAYFTEQLGPYFTERRI